MKKLIILSILFCSTNSFAATYYVAKTGNDTTGNGSISAPWATPTYGASRLTSVGDILYIRTGTYDIPTSTSNRYTAIYPRANNCTIASYPGEAVTLRGGRNGTNFGVFPTGGTIGAVNGISGLTIDGFTIQGMVMFDGNSRGTMKSTVQNCDLSVGGDGWSGTNQGAVIWIDDAVNVRVYNNRVHNNGYGSEAGGVGNNGLTMMYECTDCVIENNDYYNSVGTGITMKDDIQNVTLRNNFLHDNAAAAILTGNNGADTYAKSGDIHNNIIANNNTTQTDNHGGICLSIETSLLNIYNNTFHRNFVADVTQWVNGSVVPFTFYNNISYAPRTNHLSWPYSTSIFGATYMNYNNYYNDVAWRYRTNTYTTLYTWQTGCQSLLAGCDANSVITDPGFTNASGNWTLASDYKRSSYTTNGRGGAYPSVMGAYITGNDVIGYSVNASVLAAPAPAGLIINNQ